VQVAVVGHAEWMDFAVTPALPRPGQILHVPDAFTEAGGGGAVAAVQLRKLAGSALFVTAVGNDSVADAVHRELTQRHALEVHAARRDVPMRRGFTFLTDDHERTITVIGERIVPERADPLPWERCDEQDAIYFTGGDPGALRAARGARVLVATRGRSTPSGRPRSSSTPWWPAPTTRASGQAPPRCARARGTSCSPRAERAGAGPRRTATRGSGAPPSCPARPWTPTAAGTPSPPGSRTAWGRGWRWRTRWSSRRGAARGA
jgi:hypothetical protein